MSLTAGARLGPYEILESIGAGGMGVVYRARDTRLDRIVAVKVLAAGTAKRPEFRQRFEREARAVSALNHPHICTLHDVGSVGDIDYIVMEYLEGETLAARLRSGALPLDQALRIALESADALDRAHRTGIIHRDLKPGNIMLTKHGVKILDFGLAKMQERPAGGLTGVGSVVETLTAPLTGEGSIVGTLQYMSPEQLEGQEADARSDIFAFGGILYEMVAGRRPFQGKTQAGVIARILEHDPSPVSSVVPSTPPVLEQLIRSCLAKSPDDRCQTMHDVLLDLRWIAGEGSQLRAPSGSPGRPGAQARRPWAWMAVAAICAAAAVVLAILQWQRPRPPSLGMMRFSVAPPEKSAFGLGLAVSPDGRRVVYSSAGAKRSLWIRPLDSLAAQPLPGTEDAVFPFWSPDGRYLGFFAESKLKRLEIASGSIEVLCSAPDARGGSWNQNGVILFAPGTSQPLMQIPAAGGTPSAVTKLDAAGGERSHRWPQFLPDGRHFLFFQHYGGKGNRLAAGSLDSPVSTALTPSDSGPAFAPPGLVLSVSGGVLRAHPFDTASLRLTGDPIPLARELTAEGDAGPTGYSRFSVSPAGVLAYATGSAQAGQFTWFDRSGNPLKSVGESGTHDEPALSLDEKSLLYKWADSPVGPCIWLLDLVKGANSRFSFGTGSDDSPLWSPDGTRVVFSSKRNRVTDLYQRRTAPGSPEEVLFSSKYDKSANAWTPDGKTIIFEIGSPNPVSELWMLAVDERKATPYLQRPFNVAHSALSPDGHWLAYVSDEGGRPSVSVQRFPTGEGGKFAVSPGGGDQPSWRRDGQELYYLAPDRRFMAVPVTTGSNFGAQAPAALFQTRVDSGTLSMAGTKNSYVASADGKKFLVFSLGDTVVSTPMTVVINWQSGIGR